MDKNILDEEIDKISEILDNYFNSVENRETIEKLRQDIQEGELSEKRQLLKKAIIKNKLLQWSEDNDYAKTTKQIKKQIEASMQEEKKDIKKQAQKEIIYKKIKKEILSKEVSTIKENIKEKIKNQYIEKEKLKIRKEIEAEIEEEIILQVTKSFKDSIKQKLIDKYTSEDGKKALKEEIIIAKIEYMEQEISRAFNYQDKMQLKIKMSYNIKTNQYNIRLIIPNSKAPFQTIIKGNSMKEFDEKVGDLLGSLDMDLEYYPLGENLNGKISDKIERGKELKFLELYSRPLFIRQQDNLKDEEKERRYQEEIKKIDDQVQKRDGIIAKIRGLKKKQDTFEKVYNNLIILDSSEEICENDKKLDLKINNEIITRYDRINRLFVHKTMTPEDQDFMEQTRLIFLELGWQIDTRTKEIKDKLQSRQILIREQEAVKYEKERKAINDQKIIDDQIKEKEKLEKVAKKLKVSKAAEKKSDINKTNSPYAWLQETITKGDENYENHWENPHNKDSEIMKKDGTTIKNLALDSKKDANELKIKKSQDWGKQKREEINRKFMEKDRKITEELPKQTREEEINRKFMEKDRKITEEPAEKTREEELNLNSNINSSKVNTDENDKSKQQVNRVLILLGFLVFGGIAYYFFRSSDVKQNIKIEDEKHIENNELHNILEQ